MPTRRRHPRRQPRRMQRRPPHSVLQIFAEHPRVTWSTIASIVAVLAALGGLVLWLAAQVTLKGDFTAHVQHDAVVADWFDVGLANLRLERIGDEVDQLTLRKQIVGKLPGTDEAQLQLWQRKLAAAAADYVAKQQVAKAAGKEKTP
jgi:hypothetical protein